MTDCVIRQIAFEKLGWSSQAHESDKNGVPESLCRTLDADRRSHGSRSPPWYRRAAQHCPNDLLRNGHLNIDRASHAASSYAVDYLARIRDVIRDRTFIEARPAASRNVEQSQALVAFGPSQAMVSLDSSNTIVGLGPLNTQVGDVIAFLYGLSVPAILRPVRNFNGLECYQFIGEAYVHGRMDGEIFDTDHVETTFRLRNGAQDRRLLGPPDTRVSDIVEVTYDHSTPATLRPIKGASGMQRYRYFGDEYVNGRVGGENSSGFQVA
jgi:hypothetical protein